MEELPNNSRSNSEAASRRLLSEDPSSSGAVQPGFVRNVFFTGSAQASVDSTSSDSSDCSALAGPSAERPGSACSAPCSSPGAQAAPASCAQGPKFKLTHEGDLQLCRLNHSRTVISKILSSKFLRRWEAHKILLGTAEMASKTPSGFMENAVSYSSMEDVYPLLRWDPSHKFCLRVVIPEGSLLLQAPNGYLRDQWLHSILWKKSLLKHEKVLMTSRRVEVVTKELKGLVDLALTTPLQDKNIYQRPVDILSKFLVLSKEWLPEQAVEDVIRTVLPLLERTTPTPEICEYFCKHCKECPRSKLVFEMYTPVVHRILKRNMDFGKYPMTRLLVQEYVQALNCQNSGLQAVEDFVRSVHGEGSTCPHPRVLPNLVATVLAGVFSLFEERRCAEDRNDLSCSNLDWEAKHDCFVKLLDVIVAYEDWCLSLGQLLQPIPFPDDALAYPRFTSGLMPVVERLGTDPRCELHSLVLSARDGKDGWLQLYCPGSAACQDEGALWSRLLGTLVGCCCRRRAFLGPLAKWLGPLSLRALRGDASCQAVLCAMLELDALEAPDARLQAAAALRAGASPHYGALCRRQGQARQLQLRGGPRKLTLPARSTDADLEKLLSCGSFGNLECLSLAFTQVTSACAEHLIKLPSLRYLNLWSTQFGDSGLKLISEHLPKLQVLNLCETPVTDKGLTSLESMKSLRKLNLNSTSLSAQTFECLKEKLPALQECDVRYTDAW
ncbi:C-Maf-inducing protein [Ixodes scapularis]|uniref:C-Maf-inducing protein n=1 Tax=Ixodes scapularis TaxID=6945 RepID=UPI001A9CF6DA|nr:C-Maf-inducing protein [Ixodes scapularis]